MGKVYDVAIKAGEYKNQQGETKARWMNLGAVMKGDNGPFLLLDPKINLAAFMEPGRDMIIASLFEPKQRDGNQQQPQQQSAPQHQQQQSQSQGGGNFDDFDDDPIPF